MIEYINLLLLLTIFGSTCYVYYRPKRGRKKKADTKMNELEDNAVRDKRERLVACILSGNSKMYLGKEYTEEQINMMDCNDVNTLLNRYESILSAQMTKFLG